MCATARQLERQLARDQRRLAVVALVEDLEQIAADRIGEWREAEVVVAHPTLSRTRQRV
jgi:hypothetical protein